MSILFARATLLVAVTFGLGLAVSGCGGGGGSSAPAASAPASPPAPPPPAPSPTQPTPPRNPFLAASNWPIFHADTYASASSTTAPGPVREAQVIGSLTGFPPFCLSPWTVFGPRYADGSQPVWTTPNAGVAKDLITSGGLRAIDFAPLDRNLEDFDWALLAIASGQAVVIERRANRIALVGDAVAGDPTSRIVVQRRISVDRARYGGLMAHLSLAHDGTLMALTDANRLIAIDLNVGAVVASFDLPAEAGASFQNSFPIDERGRLFGAAQNQTVAVDWNGRAVSLAWRSTYDMRGPGCETIPINRPRDQELQAVANGERCTGTGTTPTLIGSPESGVMVIVDGHAPRNNLVAFWRNDPPADWVALRDPNDPTKFLDRRVAGVFPLPFSTPDGEGFTAQNSPAARGNAIVVAQWAGFTPDATPPTGVQRVDWLPEQRRFSLVWAAPSVLFNGVPTIGRRLDSCFAYGMGRYGNDYIYKSLDFTTGIETGSLLVGTTDDVLDQGNNHAIADDGSIVYAGRRTMVRLR